MERRHPLFDRITLDPNKCMGKPCIRGLRIPVASILGYLSAGMTIDDILREWHELEPEDIYQALGYAAWAMEERVLLPTDTPTVARPQEVLSAMGAEDYLIAATLQCAMAQRLVRVICPDCRAPYQPTPDEIAALKIPQEWLAQARFFAGKGCPKCMNTGYRGRTGIFELLRISPAIREAIVNRASSDQIMQIAVKEGYRTMLDDGRDKVLRGITTPHEVIQAVYAGVYE
jgi:uncharacterized protein (DUF433 family)